jgi:hypothetical protein
VPNSQLWNKPLANYTRNPLRRVDVRVVIPKGRDVETARHIALETAQADHRVIGSPAPEASVTEIAETNTGWSWFALDGVSGLFPGLQGYAHRNPAPARHNGLIVAETSDRRAAQAELRWCGPSLPGWWTPEAAIRHRYLKKPRAGVWA